MKQLAVVLLTVCALGAAACDDDNGTTGPSNQPLVFTAQMTAASEVPPVTNAEAGATGEATITITPTRDSSGAITGGTLRMNFTVRNLTSTSNIILAHIHTGAAGQTGGPIVNSGLSAATAIPTPAGSASFETTVTPDASIINAIVANPAGHYFNVHTTLNPGGAVRGQLRAE